MQYRRRRRARPPRAAHAMVNNPVMPTATLPPSIKVLERGWLSSNNVLLHGAPGEGAVLVDASHVNHAAQTVALVAGALAPGEALATVVNTHLHSDHCGGNAALRRAWPASRLLVPPGQAAAVAAWDEVALGYAVTRQRCERYAADGVLAPGEVLAVGHRQWQALAAPGHDPHSIVLFDAAHGVLISADALWEDGFGIVFPELDGASAFDDVAAVLDLVERLDARVVIPGHGAPFADVPGALARARARLDHWRREPQRHARHAARVMLKYHAMEEQAEPLAAWRAWCDASPLLHAIHARIAPHAPFGAWCEEMRDSLVDAGALALGSDGVVRDRA
jgi:glyoxylase-like metal-dependent hydrolase (beta-lactamase superfamily II)